MKTQIKRFTFKTEKPTGKWRSFDSDNHIIKLNKIKIGNISSLEPFFIRLKIIKKDIMEDGNPNCEWKWIKLAIKFNSLSDAKEWMQINFKKITTKFNFNFKS